MLHYNKKDQANQWEASKTGILAKTPADIYAAFFNTEFSNIDAAIRHYLPEIHAAFDACGIDPQKTQIPTIYAGFDKKFKIKGHTAHDTKSSYAFIKAEHDNALIHINNGRGYSESISIASLIWADIKAEKRPPSAPRQTFTPPPTPDPREESREAFKIAKRLEQIAELTAHYKAAQFTDKSAYFENKGYSTADILKLKAVEGFDDWRKLRYIAIARFNINAEIIGFQLVYDELFQDSPDSKPNNKLYLVKNGTLNGSFSVIGKLSKDSTFYLDEGGATGLALHKSTGLPVVVTGDTSQLQKAAKVLKEHGFNKGIIAADNDLSQDINNGNPGIMAAIKTAISTGFKVRIPELDGVKCDFDDLLRARGENAVKKQLRENNLKVPKCEYRGALLKIGYCFKDDLEKIILQACYSGIRKAANSAEMMRVHDEIKAAADKRGAGNLVNIFDVLESRIEELDKNIQLENTPDKTEGLNRVNINRKQNPQAFNNLINDMIKNGGLFIDNRPMGFGKTLLFGYILKRLKEFDYQNRRASYVCHREALTLATAKRLGMTDYKSVSPYFGESPDELALCVNSALKHLLSKRGGILFLDEFRQILNHVLHGTVDDRLNIYNELIEAINGAFLVIASDADMNDVSVKWLLENTKFKTGTLICDNTDTPKPVIIEKPSNDSIIDEMTGALEKGERVICGCDSQKQLKKAALYIKARYPDIKLLTLSSENKGDKEQADFLENPNEESKKYDCIIFTPVISSGISIENGLFKTVYGMFTATIAPNEALQTIGRVRGAERVILALNSETHDKLTENEKLLIDGEMIKRGRFVDYTSELDDFDKLRIKTQIVNNRALNDFRRYFIRLAIMKGYQVETVNNELPPVVLKIGDVSLSQAAKELSIDEVLSADNIDKATFAKIDEKANPTQSESNAKNKYMAAAIVGKNLDELTAVDVEFYDDGGGGIVANRELLTTNIEQLKEDDRINLKQRRRTKSKTSTARLGNAVLTMLAGKTLTRESIEPVAAFLVENSAEIAANKLGNFAALSSEPVRTVNRFLKRFGFEIESDGREATGKRRYLYILKDDSFVTECANRRAKIAAIKQGCGDE